MQSTEIYSPLTKPELVFGISKDAIFIFAMFLAGFMLAKFFIGYSTFWLFPSGGLIYLILFITAKVDPFYFTINNRSGRLRTKQFSKNKGNLYVS